MLSSDKDHQKAPWVGFNGGYFPRENGWEWMLIWLLPPDALEQTPRRRCSPEDPSHISSWPTTKCPLETLFSLTLNSVYTISQKNWIKHALSSCQTASTFFVLKHKVKKSFGPWNSFSVQADIEVSDASSQRYQNPLASGLQFTEKLVLV